MEEIKVGEYVRTVDGYIGKYVKDTSIKGIIVIEDNEMTFPIEKHNITKHSKNIIDLIEVGDFITLCKNGYPMLVTNIGADNNYVKEEDKEKYMMIELNNQHIIEDIKNDKDFEIYSIVTKEQFKSIEYEV